MNYSGTTLKDKHVHCLCAGDKTIFKNADKIMQAHILTISIKVSSLPNLPLPPNPPCSSSGAPAFKPFSVSSWT